MPLQYSPYLNMALANSTDNDVNFIDWRVALDGTQSTSNFMILDSKIRNIDTDLSELSAVRPTFYVVGNKDTDTLYTATITGLEDYISNMTIIISLDNPVVGNTILNINSLGERAVRKYNIDGALVELSANDLRANKNYLLRYDGNGYFVVVSDISVIDLAISGATGNLTYINEDGVVADSGVKSSSLSGLKGYFDTLEALKLAYPTGIDGDFAVVGNSLYIWNSGLDTPDWSINNLDILNSKIDKPTTFTAQSIAIFDATGNIVDGGKTITEIELGITNVDDKIDNHIVDTDNPHETTKAQVGLGNVENYLASSEIVDSVTTYATSAAVYSVNSDLQATKNYTLTHTKDGTVNTLTGLPTIDGLFSAQFVATADYITGDTFADYTAKPMGEETELPDKAFVIGDLVSVTIDTVSKKLGFKLGGGGGVNETLPILPVFSLKTTSDSAIITFTELDDEQYPFLKNYIFVYNDTNAPTNFYDGTPIVVEKQSSGIERELLINDLIVGNTYYFRVYTSNNKDQIQTMTPNAFAQIKIGSVEVLADLSVARYGLGANVSAQFSDGGAALFGGETTISTSSQSVDYYNSSKVHSSLTTLVYNSTAYAVSSMADGGVGIFGGVNRDDNTRLNAAYKYSTTKVRSSLTNLSIARNSMPASVFPGTGTGIFGGNNSAVGIYSTVDYYNISNVHSTITNLSQARYNSVSSNFVDNGVGVFGGSVSSGLSNVVDYYNSSTIRTVLTSLTIADDYTTCSKFKNGGVAVFAPSTNPQHVEYYSEAKVRTTLTSLAINRTDSTSAPLLDGVIVAGSTSNSKVLEYYDGNQIRTTIYAELSVGRGNISASPLGDGVIFLGGETNSSTPLATVEFLNENIVK